MATKTTKNQSKKTIKTDYAVAAWDLLRKANLAGLETFTDRSRIVDAVRQLREVADTHRKAMETAQETLKPQGFDELRKKAREAAALESQNEGKESAELTPAEQQRLMTMAETYNRELRKYEATLLNEDCEVEIAKFDDKKIRQILEGNPDWTAEHMIAVIDVLS